MSRVIWPRHPALRTYKARLFLLAAFLAFASPLFAGPSPAIFAQVPAADQAATAGAAGVPFTAAQLASLLPATVYFQGRTAPLQIRNAGGTSFGAGRIVWIALVDSSGYASSVQARYQFYLVTEGPLLVGGIPLAPGAYGGGFLRDHFVIMDLGGHAVAEGKTETDAALPRPRPLQVVAQSEHAVKLLLGRQSVVLMEAPTPTRVP